MELTRRRFIQGLGAALLVANTALTTQRPLTVTKHQQPGPTMGFMYRPQGFTVTEIRRMALSVPGVRECTVELGIHPGTVDVYVRPHRKVKAVRAILELSRPVAVILKVSRLT